MNSNARVCTADLLVGDKFTATVSSGTVGSNGAAIPAGSTVVLEVASVDRSDPIESSRITFRVRSVDVNGEPQPVAGDVAVLAPMDKVQSSSGNDRNKVIGGAVAGAVLGRIFGKSTKATVIGAAAGVFGIAGGRIADSLLGSTYSSGVGKELGQLVLLFSLWGAASIGVAVAFPLIFVVGLGRTLPWIAGAIVLAHVPAAFGAGRLFGLSGLALSMAVTTTVVLAVLLSELHALRTTMSSLVRASALVALLAALAFVPPALLLPETAAALTGVLVYVALIAVVRPAGLRQAWVYLRDLR